MSFRQTLLLGSVTLIATVAFARPITLLADECSLVISIEPSDDAFAKETAPATNYGTAGALAISGADAVNAFAEMNGRYDTVMKFDMALALSVFDNAFGAGNWALTQATLTTQEVGSPQNAIFNRGVGDFEVRWLSDDSWVQGPGSPFSPTVAVDNEMCWNLLQTILGSATEVHMGTYSNLSESGPRVYDLSLTQAFVTDALAGGSVSLHLLPVTSTIGYTFNSVNNGIGPNHPRLTLTAESTVGDVNCDTVRDILDVDAFVLAVLEPDLFAVTYQGCDIGGADLNGDGEIDGADISMLVCVLLP